MDLHSKISEVKIEGWSLVLCLFFGSPLGQKSHTSLTLLQHGRAEVNFTNILQAAFLPISFQQTNTNLSSKYKEAAQNTFV